MQAVRDYLISLAQARRAGVAETSGYPALKNLIDAVGDTLNPKVTLVVHPRVAGAGIPDGGLFEARRTRHHGQPDLFVDDQTLPDRGAVEVKSASHDVHQTAATDQALKYLRKYGHLLVTNYWHFALYRLEDGKPALLDEYRIANSETEFWEKAARAESTSRSQGKHIAEFLTRVCLTGVPLTQPKTLAQFLASYAREALASVEATPQDDALEPVRQALEGALGITFEEDKGKHFFNSTLVQTVFYGLFSAWVLWHEDQRSGKGKFSVESTYRYLRLPMVEPLFRALTRDQFERLGFQDLLERAVRVLHRVEEGPFFAAFEEKGAVQYFYEPFLEAFDPELRKQLGVWYTPVEIVRYQVGRVDQLLRSELGVEDGLADHAVVVLDPCCGTGAYLVEALRLIEQSLTARYGPALAPSQLKKAATERVFGFELLPAPFVVAHLQLGMELARAGAGLVQNERAGVYLTNALTGWDPREDPKKQLDLYHFAAEREAALQVKREQPILVILGNPPYNGYAGITQGGEERQLSEAYRTAKAGPQPQGQGLNDLYVRFFRMAERRVAEGEPGHGIVSFISNYSWLDSLSCPGMREKYLAAFDQVWVDNLHGDRKIGEYAPDGTTSETVFAVAGSSPGIRIGTAVSTLVRRSKAARAARFTSSSPWAEVLYRDHEAARADARRRELVKSLEDPELAARYTRIQPDPRLGYPFKPRTVGGDYLTWPRLPELMPTSFPGVKTSRDDFLVDIDRHRLEARLARYFDPKLTHEELRRLHPEVMTPSAGFDPVATRATLLGRGPYLGGVRRYLYRPFDVRWLYWEPDTKLLDRNRSDYESHAGVGQLWIEARPREVLDWCRGTITQHLGDQIGNGMSHWFPSGVALACPPENLFSEDQSEQDRFRASWNLSEAAWAGLEGLGVEDPGVVFYHTLATLHSPAYRESNAGALRQDWPRVPWPKASSSVHGAERQRGASLRAALEASAELGRRVAALLDPETPVTGVTSGTLAPQLKTIAVFETSDGTPARPQDFELRARWGYRGQGGVVMPATGRVVPDQQGLAVCLNDRTAWTGVPNAVWEYKLGGYQVLKKWLSYREFDVLGRALTVEEVAHFTDTARRIAALLALGPELDSSHQAVCDALAVLDRESPPRS